jgi:hypothetical protein
MCCLMHGGDAQRHRFGNANAVDTRRKNAASITGAFTGGE